ncbi:uncharacterized protein LOC129580286 [Sitodiplosis mosellana]|uniref:uncharacterized protein LOC129580286 n=1 Tax=Sitodiplosis mosellana TaxID=263140 RepID=UPI0024453249|nr:uncharacterized protein LOC129580286 [Sitodiplosis mosellana]
MAGIRSLKKAPLGKLSLKPKPIQERSNRTISRRLERLRYDEEVRRRQVNKEELLKLPLLEQARFHVDYTQWFVDAWQSFADTERTRADCREELVQAYEEKVQGIKDFIQDLHHIIELIESNASDEALLLYVKSRPS